MTDEQKAKQISEETKKWWKEHLLLNPENKLWMDAHQSVVFAKHFFELGLNAQKDELIDKACEFFYDKLNGGNIDCSDIEKFIEDFINVIK